jgi:hypothetical protein
MIINGLLYYKLRRIENLADGIRHDPSFVNRMMTHGVNNKPLTAAENSGQITTNSNKNNNYNQPSISDSGGGSGITTNDYGDNGGSSEKNLHQDLSSWRDVISNTLTVIQKVNNRHLRST